MIEFFTKRIRASGGSGGYRKGRVLGEDLANGTILKIQHDNDDFFKGLNFEK